MNTAFLLAQAASGDTAMDLFSRIITRPDLAIPLAGISVAIVAIISGCIANMVKHNADVRLKESMIERGMSAQEIEQVLKAK